MMQTVRFIKDPHGNVIATSKNDQCRIFIWIIRHWCVVKQQEKCRLPCKVTKMKDLIESVEAVTALGLMQGDENGSFKPKDNITKEQVIVTLLKLNDII